MAELKFFSRAPISFRLSFFKKFWEFDIFKLLILIAVNEIIKMQKYFVPKCFEIFLNTLIYDFIEINP